MSETFSLLSAAMQKYMWNEGWGRFTPIQQLAIPAILKTEDHVILSAGTASGKTEAAFLPILTAVDETAQQSLKVLYVAPLKALINDQFERIERLCESISVPVHRWHGDVSMQQKRKFTQSPSGILQITPESLESLFLNRTSLLHGMFRHLSFIVVDEVHAFLGTERGTQLRSLLSRIEEYALNKPRIVGLSATIRDDGSIARWVDSKRTDMVRILDAGSEGSQETLYALQHVPAAEGASQIPLEIFEDIRELTKAYPGMIFCNSRGLVEEAAVFLNRLAMKDSGSEDYLVHHSSIDKAERAYTERMLKTSKNKPSVVCTSTLELGIDIGDMDMVVQIDSTFSVSSLKQRIGRTGRRSGQSQMLQLYTTRRDSLLQSVAVTELFLADWVEPPDQYATPYDILFHQLLSLCSEYNGLLASELLSIVRRIAVFDGVDDEELVILLEHMLSLNYLEMVKGSEELIVGLEGERILRSKEFYSVFTVTDEYEVFHQHKRIGTLDKTPAVVEKANIILSGRLWTIDFVDDKKEKVYVVPALNAKRPIFLGSSALIHRKVGEQMMEILCTDQEYSYVNAEGVEDLRDMRRNFHLMGITSRQRLILRHQDEVIFHLFAGSKIACTLLWMIRKISSVEGRIDGIGRLRFDRLSGSLNELLHTVLECEWQPADLMPFVREQERLHTKYSPFLPDALQDELHISGRMVINETLEFLRQIELVER